VNMWQIDKITVDNGNVNNKIRPVLGR
jgi:hypothetical protein